MAILKAIVILVVSGIVTAILGLASKWIDRKVTARIHWRVGPPWYQPIADILKLLGKETIVPDTAKRTGFLLAPLFALAAVSVAAAILWSANVNPGSGFVGDLIVVIYLLTVPSLMVIIGGSSSGSQYGAVGAAREMKLMLSYELPLILAILTVVLKEGVTTFSLGGIINSGIALGSVSGFLAFLLAILCIQAKLGLQPFDIAEAETEIATGPFVEYSGPPLAVIYLTRAMVLTVLPMLLVTVFWGGFHLNAFGIPGLGIVTSALKYVVILVLLILIKNTNPRIRIDQAIKFFWFGLTPIAAVLICLSVAGY